MAKSVIEAVTSQKRDLEYQLGQAKKMRENIKNHHVERLFNLLVAAEPKCEIYVGIYSIGITVPVLSMKHMLEVCEAAENLLGFELDDSRDVPAGGQRIFSNKAYDYSWFQLIAQVPITSEDGNQTCHRVKTGVKTVEVDTYQLICDQ